MPRFIVRSFRPVYSLRVTALACAAAALAPGLGGCAVGPNYQRPATAAMPASFKEAPEGWKVAQPSDEADRGDWWTIYHDTQLNALEEQLDTQNQTIAQYAAAYRQARALVGEARAAYFPVVSASAGATRSRTPTRVSNASGSFPSGTINNNFNLGLDATWEPDLWGKVSRTVGAQEASQQGAAADLANARLSAQATLAQTYFTLRSLDAQQKLLDDTVRAYRKTLELTQNQYAQGVAGRADVVQAQVQLQSAQASAIDNGVARAQNEHAIAVLVGQPASTFSIPPSPLDATPPTVPLSMPSALLERRPDIASAERKAAAANEQIGVAISAYFPSLTISATGGFESSVLSQLLQMPSRFWTLGPSLAGTLFDGGLRSAQTEAARAAYDQQVATYRGTVLAAFQDVEDNLASQRILAEEVGVQQQAVESAQHALDIVVNEYKVGTTDYQNVLSAQTTAFQAQQKLANLAGERMVSSVGLVKALGGGWSVAQMDRETGDVNAPAPVPASGAQGQSGARSGAPA
ncbi:efflux transporter outer membrane subunit [Paraburkholderia ferrariae]|jgi:NodT family efflux transporter outer membrane factor (OMF) lipoprotein|uniref:efflux transporter outer membrane subunit n=1 Tax=Paraburkholderia ferrariae TaxID=386056 RepID=UPI0005A75931|nr:efflux transporter outer membrane subunit [Paraburkholderia ferrariae]